MKRFSKKEIFSIPNLMGYFRILMIPVFCYLYIGKQRYLAASAAVLLSSLTDLFDGKIARKFNMVTELGKLLDPVADKLTHGALALCLALRYPLMWALILLLIVKEGYMAVMGAVLLKREKTERRYVVWKGVHSRPLCRATGSVFIPSSASFLGKQPDPGDDGSDDFYFFKFIFPSSGR